MTADPTTEPTLRAVPRTWSAVRADGSHCRHGHHHTAQQADDCAELEDRVPGWSELGPTLRGLRKQAGMLVEHVADALECSDSKVSRIETGQCRPSARDVRDILVLYGVTGAAAEPLVQLARDARAARRTRWRPSAKATPAAPAAGPPVSLLTAAARLRDP